MRTPIATVVYGSCERHTAIVATVVILILVDTTRFLIPWTLKNKTNNQWHNDDGIEGHEDGGLIKAKLTGLAGASLRLCGHGRIRGPLQNSPSTFE